MEGMKRSIIAAVADNLAIGRGNALMWHISEDMKYFRKVTLGCPVIMGRKTFESIGKPLPKRLNIVVSRSGFSCPGTISSATVEGAFRIAGRNLPEGCDECFVIGGGEIYRQAMDSADRLYITHVHVSPADADTFFPEISPEEWKEESRSEMMTDPETGLLFEFAVYVRK